MGSRQYDPAAAQRGRYLPVESAMPGTTLGLIAMEVGGRGKKGSSGRQLEGQRGAAADLRLTSWAEPQLGPGAARAPLRSLDALL